ncbi:MAG TPA: C40 family peptidase [Actinomycetota bacterium]|nr:C40 family peptidase [Actinomycetota bacterium]
MSNSPRITAPLRRLAGSTLILILASQLAMSAAGADVYRDYVKQRHHVRQRAQSQIGTPYSYGGTTPSGFDCSGFTAWVWHEHGAELPHSSSGQFGLASRDGYRRIWKRENLEIGDLVFHKTTGATVGHVGIYVGNGNFISSTSSSGVQVRSLYDPYYWGPRWVGATRLPATIRYDFDNESVKRRHDRHPERGHAGKPGPSLL